MTFFSSCYFLFNSTAAKLRMLFLMLLATLAFSAQADVKVSINIDNPEHHLATVSIDFPASDDEKVILQFPAWRTGKYQILNLANSVRFFSASAAGQALDWQKTDKSSWQVATIKGQPFSVTYTVYANELGQRSRHIDDSHAYIDASGFVMYSDATRQNKFVVNVAVPEGWRSVSGMPSGEHQHQFIANDYDILIDSPIETGINELVEFNVDGRDYALVVWGEGNYDIEKMVNDLKVLVKQSVHIWQGYPFERYVFMVHATSGARGATEHLNSTIIQRSRYQFAERKDYLGFIATAAHEFVHTWNVKAYRPAGLVPYDYQQENYSNLIWLSEGSTSYLENYLLTRGDLMSAKEFFDDLAKRIERYKQSYGHNVQTVAEASFDTWIDSFGDFGQNHSVNIYSEGFLVSLALDIDLLTKTNLNASYRDVHNYLYQHHALPKSFNEQDVLNAIKQVSGFDYQGWWQTYINGTPEIDFDSLLAKAGLKLDWGKKTKASIGVRSKPHSHGIELTSVAKDSAAWQAGLTTEDIIIAVDGLRLATTDINKRLADFKPGQQVTVTFFRRDALMTKTLTLDEVPAGKLKVTPIEQASEQQQALFKAWTGLELPNQAKDNDNAASETND